MKIVELHGIPHVIIVVGPVPTIYCILVVIFELDTLLEGRV